jgi:uncharacterized protein (TIGR00297 family)
VTPLLALLIAAGLALGAWRAGALTPSGGVAAMLVGAAVLIGTGWWGGAILLAFFVGSTTVSRLLPDPAAEAGEAKGGARDAGQVLANGGAPALGALLGLSDPSLGIWALTAGLAAAAADTWATAIGATSAAHPHHLLTLRRVTPGTSGGVTWRGTFGGIAGALSVAAVGALALGELRLLAAAVVYGVAGMFIDSLLGAIAQGRFRCDRCAVATEQRHHRCGEPTRRTGGLAWLTNDGVNAVATLLITTIAAADASLVLTTVLIPR